MQPTEKILSEQLIISTVEIAKKAGEAITEIYNSGFDYHSRKIYLPLQLLIIYRIRSSQKDCKY